MTINRRTLLAATGGTILAAPHVAMGQAALTPIRFSMDWALQGPQSCYLLALERGYFREEGLAVTIDRGFGAGDVPVKIASGAYEFGVSDPSPTMRMRMTPATASTDIIVPWVLQQGSPLAVMTLRRNNIRTPQDLLDKRVAAPETDGGRQMFPAFARATGIDRNRINWVTVTPPLREPMLARGDAQAITGFETSGVFSLLALNVPREEIISMRYSSFGVNLLSTAMLVRRPYAEANPRIVTSMIRASIRGHVDAMRDPDAAIAALVRRDGTTPAPLERARLIANFEFQRTPEVISGGFGNLPMARMQGAIDTVRDAFELPIALRAEEFYLPSFLPPADQLRIPATMG